MISILKEEKRESKIKILLVLQSITRGVEKKAKEKKKKTRCGGWCEKRKIASANTVGV